MPVTWSWWRVRHHLWQSRTAVLCRTVRRQAVWRWPGNCTPRMYHATEILTCLLLLTLAILSRLLANLTGTTRDKATDSFDLKSTGHGRGRKENHPGKASTKGRHLGYDFLTSSVFYISIVPPDTSNDILTCNKAVRLATALLLHEKFYIRYLH